MIHSLSPKLMPTFRSAHQITFHNTVTIDILYSKQTYRSTTVSAEPHIKFFLWKFGDYENMHTYLLHYNWDNLFVYNLTADSLWRVFCQVLDNAIELFVPYKLVRSDDRQLPRKKKKYPSPSASINFTQKMPMACVQTRH